MKYQQNRQQKQFSQFANQRGMVRNGQGQGVRFGGNRPVNGEIISVDEKSITVKMNDDSSRIVLINDQTQINQAQEATKSDLKVGEEVAAFGQENSDGSVTAQNIQLNPISRGMNEPPLVD